MNRLSLFLYVCVSLLTINTWAKEANPRFMDPSNEGYINSLGLSYPEHYKRFNLLLIGYDVPTVRRSRRLTSRSDIMMVISFDKEYRKIDIISVGRDFVPSPNCAHRTGVRASQALGAGKLNGASVVYSRRVMAQCISSIMGEFLEYSGYSDQFEIDAGSLPIHAIYEVQRGRNANESVVGQIYGSVSENFFASVGMAWTYGDALWTLQGIARRYKVIFSGLKRRDYGAGSYQRAFNNAKFVADALGWAAPGVQSSQETGYDFLGSDMFDGVNQFISRTHSIAKLNDLLSFYKTGENLAKDNMFRYGAFYMETNKAKATRKNPFGPEDAVSPVRIFQIGHRITSYAIYQGGELDTSGARDSFLRKLRVRPVFQLPGESVQLCPDCHIVPGLGGGTWGHPDGVPLQ